MIGMDGVLVLSKDDIDVEEFIEAGRLLGVID